MFSFDESDFFGDKKNIDVKCICGNHEYKFNKRLKYFKLGIFPLLPVKIKPTLTCCKCLRRINALDKNPQFFPKYDSLFVLYHFSGWPIVLLILAFIYFLYRSMYPVDLGYRQTPKLGDIYFLDFHKINENAKYQKYPYRLAQLVSYSEKSNQLTLKIGGLSHSTYLSVLREFATQKYAYKSSYLKEHILVSSNILKNKGIVLSVRRKDSYVDVEKLQKQISFEKKILEYPSL
tara:strand:- start:12 stop:710 length:699 start_codon:yes stop_codon:yes gene_type:complete